jgi:ribonuclease HII
VSTSCKTECSPAESQRLHELTHFERSARKHGFKVLAGIDEAGRGPLAGPVVAAACIIPEDLFIQDVNDSKQLTPQERQRLFEEITADQRIIYGVGIADCAEIDLINILQATIQAMVRAIAQLTQIPELLLVDGMHLPHVMIPSQKIVKGDARSQSIAAASIIAKETRDRLMVNYDKEWPQYGFAQHKGYGTQQHLEAITKHGVCRLHRKSFEPIKSMSQ